MWATLLSKAASRRGFGALISTQPGYRWQHKLAGGALGELCLLSKSVSLGGGAPGRAKVGANPYVASESAFNTNQEQASPCELLLRRKRGSVKAWFGNYEYSTDTTRTS